MPFQRRFKCVTRTFQGSFKFFFKIVAGVFLESFKEVSRKIEGCFKRV